MIKNSDIEPFGAIIQKHVQKQIELGNDLRKIDALPIIIEIAGKGTGFHELSFYVGMMFGAETVTQVISQELDKEPISKEHEKMLEDYITTIQEAKKLEHAEELISKHVSTVSIVPGIICKHCSQPAVLYSDKVKYINPLRDIKIPTYHAYCCGNPNCMNQNHFDDTMNARDIVNQGFILQRIVKINEFSRSI